jgi:hypothetical protein
MVHKQDISPFCKEQIKAEMSTPWLSCAEAQGMWTGRSRAWRIHVLEDIIAAASGNLTLGSVSGVSGNC